MPWMKILPNLALLFFTPDLFKNKNRFMVMYLFYLIFLKLILI
ncbi:hypothetical protein HMPREF1567_2528 [Providencia alcalifaciens PAL-2]|uniref:Uncharacterized protein n=1 Tax=Providencia alcalifaciens 205/92 TaxID=1256988 RepID=A0AAV3M1Y6_9GAMM|nr:hypothetical protein HMPREF1562_2102 [Providencia alcalifaciens F90-2004]EUC97119.1 hypothetical protein HMPREF1567_2528 [Providencia alcalifaciens PAL-2]EUD09758.1 hypothetical protein HMPREF1563_0661 [Providencia alcalifaciens 205/92]